VAVISDDRFKSLFGGAGEASGPGALPEPPACPPQRRHGGTPIDLVVGLAVRAALAVQFFTWARANARPVDDPFDWRAWLQPDPGLIQAAPVWTVGRIDPALTAFVLLACAMAIGLSLSVGFLTRLAGILIVVGAIWHVTSVLPSAWPQTLAYAALGLYLALRGAGPASMDWALARLSRMG
jgi:uncharacterized membrane protein YphA (DoxX/SURF4 family)